MLHARPIYHFFLLYYPRGHFLFPFKTWKSIYLASTEQYGILENLFPGDITLADHGFTVEDAVGLYCAQVIAPPISTEGKKKSEGWSREINITCKNSC